MLVAHQISVKPLRNEEFLRNLRALYQRDSRFRLLLDSCFHFKIPLFYSSGGSWRVCRLRDIREQVERCAPRECVRGLLVLLEEVFPSDQASERLLLGGSGPLAFYND